MSNVRGENTKGVYKFGNRYKKNLPPTEVTDAEYQRMCYELSKRTFENARNERSQYCEVFPNASTQAPIQTRDTYRSMDLK